MQARLFRQLEDIQIQAERLITGTPTEEELDNFSAYNLELKKYLREHTSDPEVLQRVDEIPDVMQVEVETNRKPVLILILFALFTLGLSAMYLSYVAGMRRTQLIQNNIHTVRGIYASIEFLLKAQA